MDDESVKPSSVDNLSMKQVCRRGKLPKRKTPHFPEIEKAKLLVRFKSENPFFKIVIHPSYLKSRNNVVSFSLFDMVFALAAATFFPCFKFFEHCNSYSSCKFLQNVPLKFAMAHLKEGAAIVSISNGGSWPVRFKLRQISTDGRLRFEFRHGWKEFVKANDLKVGDICVFELLKKSENSLRVFIVRAADDANHHKSQGNYLL